MANESALLSCFCQRFVADMSRPEASDSGLFWGSTGTLSSCKCALVCSASVHLLPCEVYTCRVAKCALAGWRSVHCMSVRSALVALSRRHLPAVRVCTRRRGFQAFLHIGAGLGGGGSASFHVR